MTVCAASSSAPPDWPPTRQRGRAPAGRRVDRAASGSRGLSPAQAAPPTQTRYEIRPFGARLRAFQATPADQIPDPPCGAYGWSTHGVRYLLLDQHRPDRVLYLDEGQDGTLIQPATLRWD